jgi:hypothetical protein
MCHTRKNLSLSSPVALQLIGDDEARDVGQAFEQLTEELLRGALIPAALHKDIQHMAFLIDRPPQIMALALDRQKHLIHVLLVAWPGTTATELRSILLPEFAILLADRLIGYDDSAFKQELFDIPEA